MKDIKWQLLLISVIVFSLILKFGDVSFIGENHFNLITVNSVTAGFLFTTLSILLGFFNEPIVEKYDRTGALENLYSSIKWGIVFGLISIALSLLNMIFLDKYLGNIVIAIKIFYTLELLFLIISFYQLYHSILELMQVVSGVREDRERKLNQRTLNDKINNIIEKNNSNSKNY